MKLCGSLHAVTSDRYRIAVLLCFHLTPADRRGLQWSGRNGIEAVEGTVSGSSQEEL